METINIKFDEKQLEEVVKKVTEELKKEKANFYELSDTKQEEKKKKWSVMYLEANVSHCASEEKKVYFGHLFNTLSKEVPASSRIAPMFLHTWSACPSIVSASTVSVAGLIAICPAE